jgi:TolA-binding protein
MQPARHALGALLLEQQRCAEAETVYRTDLDRHPNNPWALHGLAECLAQLGNADEAAAFQTRFTAACQRSDVKIDRSCYCRLGTVRN